MRAAGEATGTTVSSPRQRGTIVLGLGKHEQSVEQLQLLVRPEQPLFDHLLVLGAPPPPTLAMVRERGETTRKP